VEREDVEGDPRPHHWHPGRHQTPDQRGNRPPLNYLLVKSYRKGWQTVTIHIPGSVRPCKDDHDITIVSRVAHWIGMLREIGDQPDNQPLMPWRDREGSFTSLLNDPRFATDDAQGSIRVRSVQLPMVESIAY
jgi:hypothetical protein